MIAEEIARDAALRLLIVDDEPLALRRLEQTLSTMPGVEIVGSARDGDAAVAEARRLAPDLVILDVEMPGQDGLSVAAAIVEHGGAEIVIHSAFDRYATAAFEVEALDYLVKPVRQDRLRQAVERARRRRRERQAHRSTLERSGNLGFAAIHVPDRNGGRDVPLSDIVWIEAARDYALLHTATRSHILRTTMTELVARLPEEFLRVHRSAFVSLSRVRRWGLPSKGVYSLVLADGIEVGVGPSYLAETRHALRSLQI